MLETKGGSGIYKLWLEAGFGAGVDDVLESNWSFLSLWEKERGSCNQGGGEKKEEAVIRKEAVVLAFGHVRTPP